MIPLLVAMPKVACLGVISKKRYLINPSHKPPSRILPFTLGFIILVGSSLKATKVWFRGCLIIQIKILWCGVMWCSNDGGGV